MTPRRQFVGVLVLGLAFLVVFRMLEPTNYQIGVLMRCMILMIVAIGLNVLIGHAGLVSLGQAALYGLGSYTAAWLAVKAGVPFLPAIAAGILVAALFGVALAYPTVRVRGVYLAVITIAFGLVFQNILVEWLSVTGGTQGLIGIPRGQVFGVTLTRPDLLLGGVGLSDPRLHRPVHDHPLPLRARDAGDGAERERGARARDQRHEHPHSRLRGLGGARRASPAASTRF